MSEYDEAWTKFAAEDLRTICAMPEEAFGLTWGMDLVETEAKGPENYYFFQDNGADVLAVAHLDTVVADDKRTARFVETDDGWVVHSGALDDRLGAYVLLSLLPALGIEHDILLTVGEESGCSTAEYFEPPEGKEYNWGIEFDRGGTDVVMYQYDDHDTDALVRASGARTGHGSFSDIAYLEHLEVKCFNWGVGYHDYHTVRGYAYLDDTMEMVGKYLKFNRTNAGIYLPHEMKPRTTYGSFGGGTSLSSHHNRRDWERDYRFFGDEKECDTCHEPYWYCDCDVITLPPADVTELPAPETVAEALGLLG